MHEVPDPPPARVPSLSPALGGKRQDLQWKSVCGNGSAGGQQAGESWGKTQEDCGEDQKVMGCDRQEAVNRSWVSQVVWGQNSQLGGIGRWVMLLHHCPLIA